MDQPGNNNQSEKLAVTISGQYISSQADLDPKDQAMPEMLAWCRQQQDVVVLKSGTILSTNLGSRQIPNCKIVMAKKGITPGQVLPASAELVSLLLENAAELLPGQSVESPVSVQQQRLRQLVKEALQLEATDIHIEVRVDTALIRFRKHGELFLHAEWIPQLAREICSVAFNKETDHAVSHFNPLVPQSASMPLRIDDRQVRLRLASLPAHGGFDVILRLLTTSQDAVPTLASLGYHPSQVAVIRKAISLPYGAVIVAGPTGSGKTTTLASCMQHVSTDRKIYTIEDPVERFIPTATQVPVNTEHYDRSFASMARTTLRMDPDVIVLGEMRDEDTAQVLMRAAVTGHLVFSTLHTNTAVDIVTRLEDLGVARHLLATHQLLSCLICQRLVPWLCAHCAVPAKTVTADDAVQRWQQFFGAHFDKVRARGPGCSECHGLGISGRRVVAEIIWVDARGREFIRSGDLLGWRQYLAGRGWMSYEDQLIDHVRQGQCDPADVERMLGEVAFVPESETYFEGSA